MSWVNMSMVSTEPPALPGHPDELGSPWASGQMWKGGRLGKVHVGWEVGAILKKMTVLLRCVKVRTEKVQIFQS